MCNIALMRNILSGKPRFCGGRPFFCSHRRVEAQAIRALGKLRSHSRKTLESADKSHKLAKITQKAVPAKYNCRRVWTLGLVKLHAEPYPQNIIAARMDPRAPAQFAPTNLEGIWRDCVGVFPERLYSVQPPLLRKEYVRHEIKSVNNYPAAAVVVFAPDFLYSQIF